MVLQLGIWLGGRHLVFLLFIGERASFLGQECTESVHGVFTGVSRTSTKTSSISVLGQREQQHYLLSNPVHFKMPETDFHRR